LWLFTQKEITLNKMDDDVISKVSTELKKKIDPSYELQRYFKKPIKYLGVRSPDIRKIVKNTCPTLPKQNFLDLCADLLKLEEYEYSIVAFQWAYLRKEDFDKSDFSIFEKWLHEYVTNWGLCDSYVPYLLNYFLVRYPSLMKNVKKWTLSENSLVRRASAVVFLRDSGGVKPTLQELKDILWVAISLQEDEDDLVQKGCGWLLKNASMEHQQEVFEFVMQNKHKMKKTVLRYAIEKMPQELKKKAMEKRNTNKQ